MDQELQNLRKQFLYYKSLGDKTFPQIPEVKLFWFYNLESNSIAVIVKHLWGNMMSRWTNLMTDDGEKTWRDRDGEFQATISSKKEMLEKWEEGWNCLFDAIDSLTAADLHKEIYIRNMGCSVLDAIHRQLAHYAYHVGQITFIGRMIAGEDWESLSIPLGQSKTYNQEKFGQEKKKQFFADEFLEGEPPETA